MIDVYEPRRRAFVRTLRRHASRPIMYFKQEYCSVHVDIDYRFDPVSMSVLHYLLWEEDRGINSRANARCTNLLVKKSPNFRKKQNVRFFCVTYRLSKHLKIPARTPTHLDINSKFRFLRVKQPSASLAFVMRHREKEKIVRIRLLITRRRAPHVSRRNAHFDVFWLPSWQQQTRIYRTPSARGDCVFRRRQLSAMLTQVTALEIQTWTFQSTRTDSIISRCHFFVNIIEQWQEWRRENTR